MSCSVSMSANIYRQLKRQHSADPLGGARQSPSSIDTPIGTATPPSVETSATTPALNITNNMFGKTALPNDSVVGSPLKKQRATTFSSTPDEAKVLLNAAGLSAPTGNVLSLAEAAHPSTGQPANAFIKTEMEEEEL